MHGVEVKHIAGNFGIMITNDGPHSSEQLALNTTKRLIDLVPSESDGRAQQALILQDRIINWLAHCYRELQTAERYDLHAKSMVESFATFEFAQQTADNICHMAEKTPWAELFARHKSQIIDILHREFNTAVDIERQWFVDRH